jgi:uncharacterized protein YxjI
MKLLFKQRLFSWFDSYDIYDEIGRKVFTVEGEPSLGHCLRIYDANRNELGMIQERFFKLMPTFDLYVGDDCVGSIKREFTLFSSEYDIDYNGWHIDGDWLEWDYTIADFSGREVAKISKELLNLTDTYTITIHNPKDALCALMVVLAIDAEKCSQRD